MVKQQIKKQTNKDGLQALFFFFGGIYFQNPEIKSEQYTCRPRFLSNCEISLASHAGIFRGARGDEIRAPLKTPAWEAKISLAQQWHAYHDLYRQL